MTSFHERLAAAATPGPWRIRWSGILGADGSTVAKATKAPHDTLLIAACPPEMVQAWENVAEAARAYRSIEDAEPWLVASDRLSWEQQVDRAAAALDEALAAYDVQVAALQEKP